MKTIRVKIIINQDIGMTIKGTITGTLMNQPREGVPPEIRLDAHWRYLSNALAARPEIWTAQPLESAVNCNYPNWHRKAIFAYKFASSPLSGYEQVYEVYRNDVYWTAFKRFGDMEAEYPDIVEKV